MTRAVAAIDVEFKDGAFTHCGTVEYMLDLPYEDVDDMVLVQQVKADPRVGYKLENGVLEVLGQFFPLSDVRRMSVRLLLKERLDGGAVGQ